MFHRTLVRHLGHHSSPHTLGEMRATRVLLAEDDPPLRHLLAATLRKAGYEVAEASDGGELLDRIGSGLLHRGHPEAPDLIVSDVRMPMRSGLDVLAGLRSADWATPVILITAFGDDELHAEAKRLGAAAVFDKPFDLDDFKMAVLHFASPR